MNVLRHELDGDFAASLIARLTATTIVLVDATRPPSSKAGDAPSLP